MKHRDRILAGTAIGILMAASSMSAHAMQAPSAKAKVEQPAAPIILAQAADDQEKKQPETTKEAPARAEEQPESQPAEPKATEEAPAQPEPQAAEEQPTQPEPQAAEEAPAQPEPKAAEEQPAQPEPQAAEEQPAQQQPKAAEEKPAQPEPKAAEEKPAEPKAAEEEPAQPKAAEEEPAQPEPKAEEAPAEPKAAEEEPAQPKAAEEEAAKPDPKATEKAPAQPKAAEEEPAQPEPKAAEEEPAQPEAAEEEAAKPEPKATEGEAAEPKATEGGGEQAQPSDEATTGEQQEQNAAPMLDSEKDAAQGRDREGRRDGEARRDRGDNDRNADRDRNRDRRDRNAERDRDRAERRPDSDQAAQRDIDVTVQDVQRLNDEEGRRIDRAQFRDFRRREGAKVVEKTENRTLIQFNNQIIVQDNSHDRIRVDARDVYYEELPNQLRREVVIRPNGTRIITVRNSYGDIVSRTRVVNDQRYVLIYAGDDSYDGRWQDPAANLPPLQIDIPRSEYILEAEAVNDPDRYYQFLDQPPVVPVENLYTIDQVKYSARVRDMVRRVDLDTINFETGSADIARSELQDLQALATAIRRMIDENPAETFLIEGHTDAVGSAESNLILSDERAESVATALTNAYDIPPENLFTQGYGEQYLKVETEGASRENRRVAVRRITPLVSPVASAQQ